MRLLKICRYVMLLTSIAMNAAGCEYGLHLDMNPYHTSFIFYRFDTFEGDKRPEFRSELLLKEMLFSANRYVNGAPKDFFFLTLKDSSPGPGWSASGFAQPAPAFIPAVFSKESNGCKLVAIDLTRASVEFAPGEIPENLAPAGVPLEPGDEKNMLVDVSLGSWSSTRGQLVEGTVVATLNPGQVTLGLSKAGEVVVGLWPLGELDGGSVANAVQGRRLAESSPSRKVTVLGLMGARWMIIGEGTSDKLAPVMEELGVRNGIAFEGGDDSSAVAIRGEKGMIDLAGAPVTARDTKATTLRVIARPKSLGMKRLETLFGENTASSKD